MDDPLQDLAPFLASVRSGAGQELPKPPEYLTRRLMRLPEGTMEPAVSPVPEEETLPRTFGPYLLESVLGRGGMGTVYRGYDAELERFVAVKVLSPGLTYNSAARTRFLREARAMARLGHDALMPLLTVHQETSEPCFTMPWLAGESLHDRIHREGKLPVEEVEVLARQICQGLSVAHESGLVHRDLKPSNVFLEEVDGGYRARVMDFGLAKAYDEPSVTRTGELTGTPAFMAPEQIDGDEVDARADLYALGATLFTAITGHPPFEGKTITGTLRQVAEQKAPILGERDGGTPPWFSALINDLLAKDPSDRPADAQAVLRRLDSRVVGPPATTVSANKIVLVAAGMVAVFLVGFLLISKAFLDPKPESEFDFGVSLAQLESGEVLQIPEGTFSMESFDLGSRDVVLEGAGRKTRLVFKFSEEASIRTAGNLTLRNLTVDCSATRSGESLSLVSSTGALLTFEDCRIEQSRAPSRFPEGNYLLEVSPGSETVIQNSEVYTFHTITWRGESDASLLVEDSIVVSPGLIYATEVEKPARVLVNRSTCMSQVLASLITSQQESKSLDLTLCQSVIDSSFSLLWFPLGGEKLLASQMSYRGEEVLVMTTRNLVSTGLRPRGNNGRAKGKLEAWRARDWREFWGTAESGVQFSSTQLTRSGGMADAEAELIQAAQFALPSRMPGYGAPLRSVGPKD